MSKIKRIIVTFITLFVVLSTIPIQAQSNLEQDLENTKQSELVELENEHVIEEDEKQTEEILSFDTKSDVRTNLALNKPVTAGNTAVTKGVQNIVDGNLDSYWDGGAYPSYVIIDLQDRVDLEEIKVVTYFKDTRYYHYEISGSNDGLNYDLLTVKDSDDLSTKTGDSYLYQGKEYRYIKVNVTFNNKNVASHLVEVEVYGEVIEIDHDKDPLDELNIAYKKPTRATSNNEASKYVTDGSLVSEWVGEDFPKHVDVDLLDNYALEDVVVFMNTDTSYTYTLYGSLDGVRFTRIFEQNDLIKATNEGHVIPVNTSEPYRVIRLNVTSNDGGMRTNSIVKEIRAHGTKLDTEVMPTREHLNIKSYDDWMKDTQGIDLAPLKDSKGNYDIKDTFSDMDVYAEIYALVERILGANYKDWFTFEITKNPKENGEIDFFEISMKNGKVHIKGNEGVSITSGLNHYLKYYANVHISQETEQVTMPQSIVNVDQMIFKETNMRFRYAYNYCTLSYTMPFWGYDKWQREMDWLALSGINVILDLSGTEAMMVNYLKKFNYNTDEAKRYITGQSYKAWWLMDNIEEYGGPVTDEWIIDNLELARTNQRKMSILGIQPVQQAFVGSLPTDFAKFAKDGLIDKGFEDITPHLIDQGDWANYTQPLLLSTDYDGYEYLAKEYYESQEFAFGQLTQYYAGDLAHEGGYIPDYLNKSEMSLKILNQMLDYNEDSIWVIQSWGANPNKDVLNGFGQENRENHVLVLDLNASSDERWSNTSRWGSKEFGGTSWAWTMLDNYGGRPGVHGELETITKRIAEAKKTSTHLKGLGFTSEGTEQNPINYELLFEMIWEEEAVDLDEWLENYLNRRYGGTSADTLAGWKLVMETAYAHHNEDGVPYVHQATANTVSSLLPQFQPAVGLGHIPIHYDIDKFEEGVNLIFNDFDQYKDEETYRYDMVHFLRQVVSNSQYEYFNRIIESYSYKDIDAFKEYRDKFLETIMLLDEVSSYQENSLYGTWIGHAEDYMNDPRNSDYDDFGEDMMIINAKALVSTWGSKYWSTYAHRQYTGLVEDFHYPIWEMWLDGMEQSFTTGSFKQPSHTIEFFNVGWAMVMNDKQYSRTRSESMDDFYSLYESIFENHTAEIAKKDSRVTDNIAPKGTAYALKTSGNRVPALINDGSFSTYWWSDGKNLPTHAGIKFNENQKVYGMTLVFEPRTPVGADIMKYDVELLDKNNNVIDTLFSATNYDEDTKMYTVEYMFEDFIDVENVRVNFTENKNTMYPAIAEFMIFSSQGLKVSQNSTMSVNNNDLYGVKNYATVEEVEQQIIYAKHNNIFSYDSENNVLAKDASASLIERIEVKNSKDLVLEVGQVVDEDNIIIVLEDLITRAENLTKEDYTKDTFEKVNTALVNAKQVLESEPVNVALAINAADQLEKAMDKLISVKVLKEILEEIEDLEISDYKENYIEKHNEYLEKATITLGKDDASQTEINKAIDNARLAKKHLIRKSDVNIAPKGIAYVDSQYSSFYSKEKINDEDLLSVWAAADTSVPVSGGIKFNETHSVNKLRVMLEENGYRNTKLGFIVEIEVENNWTKVYEGETGLDSGYDFEIELDEVYDITQVRVTFTSYSTDSGSPKPGLTELFVFEAPDKSALIELYNQYNNLELENYTEESREHFEKVLEEVLKVIEDNQATSEDVVSSQDSLQEAFDNLVEKGEEINTSRLEILVSELKEIDHDLYTEESLLGLEEALVRAEQIISNPQTQQEVHEMLTELSEIKAGLVEKVQVDVSALEELILELENLTLEDYDEESQEALTQAILNAKQLLTQDPSQEEVDQMIEALIEVRESLKLVEPIDTSELETLINEAKKIDLTKYTPESVEYLQIMIGIANDVLENPTTQEDVDQAINDLNNAIKDLEKIVFDLGALEVLIDEISTLDLTPYTDESVAALKETLVKAKDVLENPESQDEVDEMVKLLKEKVEGLIKKEEPVIIINTDALNELINQADALDLSLYTDQSVRVFKEVIENARLTLKDAKSQDDVDRAYTALTEAFSNLKLKETEGGKDKQPPTGIEGNVSYVYISLVLASVSLLFILKKRNLLFKK